MEPKAGVTVHMVVVIAGRDAQRSGRLGSSRTGRRPPGSTSLGVLRFGAVCRWSIHDRNGAATCDRTRRWARRAVHWVHGRGPAPLASRSRPMVRAQRRRGPRPPRERLAHVPFEVSVVDARPCGRGFVNGGEELGHELGAGSKAVCLPMSRRSPSTMPLAARRAPASATVVGYVCQSVRPERRGPVRTSRRRPCASSRRRGRRRSGSAPPPAALGSCGAPSAHVLPGLERLTALADPNPCGTDWRGA